MTLIVVFHDVTFFHDMIIETGSFSRNTNIRNLL
jgi:hypothetical protein